MTDYANLRFLPWMRRGIARELTTAADADGVPTAVLPSVDAAVTVGTTEIVRALRVRGPGAVVGIAPGQIVRQDPLPGTLDFETNYFPAIELVSPDLPWMFTPASPTANKLMPWLVLVVVEEREGVTLASRTSAPLDVLTIDDARRELPNLREAWAWAHVQAAVELTPDVDTAFTEQPEAFVARLMCPRRLGERTSYLACLVPSFEAGRLAGLGLTVDPDAAPALAWSETSIAVELPVYCSWSFRTTAEPGDFEALVRRLTARTLGSGVGMHDLDIGDPGSTRLPYSPGTIVGFTGALVSPNVKPPVWDSRHRVPFQDSLRTLLNEAPPAAAAEDPVVAPPIYGALPAGIDDVPAANARATSLEPKWLSQANIDPANRSAAGLGAEVVRRNQESLVAEAWDQAAALRQVNRVLNQTRLALEVGNRIKLRVDALEDGALLQFSRPAHPRLKRADMTNTLEGRVAQSALPNGLVSGAFRRRLRSGTTVSRSAASSTSPATRTLAARVTQEFVQNPEARVAYAAFTIPHGTVFEDQTTQDQSGSVVAALRAVDVSAAFGLGNGGGTPVVVTGHVTGIRGGLSLEGRVVSASSAPVLGREKEAAAVDMHVLTSPTPVVADQGGETALAPTEMAALVREKLDPGELLRVRVRALITAPAGAFGAEPVPARMTFSPSYPIATYQLLARIDPELLLPGVGQIPDDTCALASVNAAFVEAFLLGANHELGREFIWREVPVDPADTWLRTFWDSAGGGVENIARTADWTSGSLGTHPATKDFDPDQVLVLIVKGDLFRRYPRTLVYAVPARWSNDNEAAEWERSENTDVEAEQPIFVGSLGKDVVFFGFQFDADVDVDVDVAGSPVANGPHPGWFFVFEQPPIEPRFGLDLGRPAQAGTKPRFWKNVSWYHAVGSGGDAATHAPLAPLDDGVARQYDERGENTWTETWARNAAAMARVTFQRPVRMLVHADQMLRAQEEN